MASRPILLLLLILPALFFIFLSSGAQGYTNYTVGDALGWFDVLERPDADYRRWAAGKNFTLGDFLIFNTDNNHSVIQTYNFTTFDRCDYADASESDTVQWSVAEPSSTAPHPVSVAVPLVKTGATYFFSGDYDGEQCQNGQQLQIVVAHGQGLPPGLGDSPAPAAPDSGDDDDDAVPETLVPSNFDNAVGDDTNTTTTTTATHEANGASSSLVLKFLFHARLHQLLVAVGILVSM